MSDVNETGETRTTIFESTIKDSALHSFSGESLPAKISLNDNQDLSHSTCSDLVTELLQRHKRLREREIQVRSLSLILNHENNDTSSNKISHAVFFENKSELEKEIVKIKQEIKVKEARLQQNNGKLFEHYVESTKDDHNSKFCALDISKSASFVKNTETFQNNGDGNFNHGSLLKGNLKFDVPECVSESLNQSFESDYFLGTSLDEECDVVKLRRILSETEEKHKAERNEIMKQLKSLQIATVQGETNWKCVLKEKQLRIEELSERNTELQSKCSQVASYLKIWQKIRQKDAKESEKSKEKDEQTVLSLTKENSSFNQDMKELLDDVKELRNIKEELNKRLNKYSASNKELEKDLRDANSKLVEKSRLLEKYSGEISETNVLVNKLVIKVNCLNTDKENLKEQLQTIKTQNSINLEANKVSNDEQLEPGNSESSENKRFVHISVQTDEMSHELLGVKEELGLKEQEILRLYEQFKKQESFLKRLKEDEIKRKKENDLWKYRSLQNERLEKRLHIEVTSRVD